MGSLEDPLVAAIGLGAALFLLIFILFGSNKAVESDLRGRLGSYVQDDTERKGLSRIPLLRRFIVQAETVAEERGILNNIEKALEQANLPVRAGEAIAGAIAGALLIGLFAFIYTTSALWGVIAAALAMLGAVTAVQTVAGRERTRFEGQLPDTLNLISTSLRAGYSLLQAVEAVAQEAPEPTRREFGRAAHRNAAGPPAGRRAQGCW